MPEGARSAHDELLFALKLGGRLSAADLALRCGLSPSEAEAELERLRNEGLVRPGSSGGLERLSEAGHAKAATVLVRERESLGVEIEGLLPAFDRSNASLKELLRRWQLRPLGPTTVVNDHADSAYDDRVLADLGALIAEAESWLDRLPTAPPRYARYRARLAAAVKRAGQGEPAFVSGLDVDSVHSIWWQLHADLLAVAGRERGEDDA